jgi:broad specificity phosphatase PhoE
MNNTLVFLRHAETKKDKNIRVSQWILTESGKKSAEDLAESGIFDDVDVIISSGEEKAYLTAKPFADRLGKKIVRVPELNELNRDKGEMMSKEEYDQMKVKIFEDLDYTDHGWETARHALNRFKQAVDKIDEQYENKKILIVAHGTVMTLYFAYLQNKLDDIFSRWKGLGFCGWGIVKNKKVLRDIV